jgi:hypothetical protein
MDRILRSNGNVILFAALAALLLPAVAAGATDVFAAKKTYVDVTVHKWIKTTKVVKYDVFKQLKNGYISLGERTYDFKENNVKPSIGQFTVPVYFKVDKLHNGDKISVCAHDLEEYIDGCAKDFKYKKGKTFKASIDFQLTEDDD